MPHCRADVAVDNEVGLVFFLVSGGGGWISCFEAPGATQVCADMSTVGLVYEGRGITLDPSSQLIYVVEKYDMSSSDILVVSYDATLVKVRGSSQGRC